MAETFKRGLMKVEIIIMYKKILVALDRSPQAEAVFQEALEIAQSNQSSLMLVHSMSFENQGVGAFSDIYGNSASHFSKQINDSLVKEGEEIKKWLSQYHQKALERGINAEWNCNLGDPGRWIREIASTWKADLVVVGRRGRRSLTEMLLGSVSNHVVHHAPCSVLVVQS